MSRPSPLFVRGNKRSGTSLLCKILNTHPGMYISFESDVIWIIWQMMRGKEEFSRYPWDGDVGLKNTLEYIAPHLGRLRDELRHTKDVQGLYENTVVQGFDRGKIRECYRCYKDYGTK